MKLALPVQVTAGRVWRHRDEAKGNRRSDPCTTGSDARARVRGAKRASAMSATGLIVVGVFIVGFVGIVVGYHTKAGSGIELHPSDGVDHEGGAAAPQSEGIGTLSAQEDGGTDSLDSHGTG
jgi:hypothetical protein